MKSRISFPITISFSEIALLGLFTFSVLLAIEYNSKKTVIENSIDVDREDSHGIQEKVSTDNSDEAKEKNGLEGKLLENEELKKQIKNLEKVVEELNLENEELDNQIGKLEQDYAELHTTNEDLHTEKGLLYNIIGNLEQENKVQEYLDEELMLRRKLIGLQGNLKNVVFVFDKSDSIRSSGRWDLANSLLRKWTETLQMEKCGIIVFGDTVDIFNNGNLYDITSSKGEEAYKKISKWLDNQLPENGTNLQLAIEAVYTYEGLDSVILFTDGRVGNTQRRHIFETIENNDKSKTIPINVIGIGNYFAKVPSKLLMELAKRTNGSYRGY